MTFVLAELPYDYGALAPHISADTLRVHHDKHHGAYVENVNRLVRGSELAGKSLEHIIRHSAAHKGSRALFNNAAQAWNHEFYWRSMRPSGGGEPRGLIAERIDLELGGHEAFAEQFASAATGQFGSGWAWLVLSTGKLQIVQTSNGDTPIAHGQAPLLTLDVWEHAYYLDYQSRRAEYVAAFIAHLIDWDFANENLDRGHEKVAATAAAGERPHGRERWSEAGG